MSMLLNAIKNVTHTENGAVSFKTTLDANLDMFAQSGAMRHRKEQDIIDMFELAILENKDLALKNLFYARDIRGGIGERRFFRICMQWLANHYKEYNIDLGYLLVFVNEYGRWDDVVDLINTPARNLAMVVIDSRLSRDIKLVNENRASEISLLGKWMPSNNASASNTVKTAKVIARGLKMSDKDYRKTLVKLRAAIKIIENNLRMKDYSFDYSKQPSKAMLKYRKAFWRNDEERYQSYLSSVERGDKKLNTSTLVPYDIIAPLYSGWGVKNPKQIDKQERRALDVTWNALPDFTNDENALVVVDGSGSMYGCKNPSPAAVAQSLGIYFAERNKGIFHNHFITFSSRPKLVEVEGKDIAEKVYNCSRYDECANTNIEATFKLILRTAIDNEVPQNEMPTKLYIISDMQFDCMTSHAETTVFRRFKAEFEDAGYKFPDVIFWNVAAREGCIPVTKNDRGVALVSGVSPAIFSMLKDGELDPVKFMNSVLLSERYARIHA